MFKRLKKFATVGMATIMLMGMATNVTAVYDDGVRVADTIIMEGYGNADCILYCNYGAGYAMATTTIHADPLSYYVYAYAEVEIELLDGGGYLFDTRFASGDSEKDIDPDIDVYTVQAAATAREDVSYNIGIYSCSSHLAEIDEASEDCFLRADDY